MPAKQAMRSLKKRINHRNPNVQLTALALTDTCVKNGGDHFLVEIVSREFLDNLTSLVRAPTTNTDVKAKMLELVQTWAMAFEGRPQLGYAMAQYRDLKAQNYDFPEVKQITGSYVDSTAPPEWGDSDVCMRCRTPFSITNRKHHCRNCGQTFDQNCSSRLLPLPHLGINTPVRVDDGCYFKLVDKTASKPVATKSPTPLQPRDARVQDNDDEDLKMALQMSLEEAQRNAPKVQQLPKPATVIPSKKEDEEDADMKAAIEASLRDLKIQPAAQSQFPPQQESGFHYPTVTRSQPEDSYAMTSPAPITQQRPEPPQRPARQETLSELSTNDIDNISLFATLIEKMLSAPSGTILREPRIQELYESIETLRPRLNKSLSSTIDRYESLLDMHAKLTTVMRSYDKMLEDRLSTTYNYATYNANDAPQQSYYPPKWQQQQQIPPQSPTQLHHAQERPSFSHQSPIVAAAATTSSSSTHAPPLSPPIPISSQPIATRGISPEGGVYQPPYAQQAYDQHRQYFPNNDYRQPDYHQNPKPLVKEEPPSLIDL